MRRTEGEKLELLRLYYPNNKNKDIAVMLGLSPATVGRVARREGLRKDTSFLRQTAWENLMLARHRQRGENATHKPRKSPKAYEDMTRIYERWQGGERLTGIASEYGLGLKTLHSILTRHNYKRIRR